MKKLILTFLISAALFMGVTGVSYAQPYYWDSWCYYHTQNPECYSYNDHWCHRFIGRDGDWHLDCGPYGNPPPDWYLHNYWHNGHPHSYVPNHYKHHNNDHVDAHNNGGDHHHNH